MAVFIAKVLEERSVSINLEAVRLRASDPFGVIRVMAYLLIIAARLRRTNTVLEAVYQSGYVRSALDHTLRDLTARMAWIPPQDAPAVVLRTGEPCHSETTSIRSLMVPAATSRSAMPVGGFEARLLRRRLSAWVSICIARNQRVVTLVDRIFRTCAIRRIGRRAAHGCSW